MIFAHYYNHPSSDPLEFVLPASALAVLGGSYIVLALRAARDSRGWSRWRTTSFMSGVAFLALALLPGVGIAGDDSFVAHMAQHLIIAMIAPIALVLGAPMTLLLRVLSPQYARIIGRILRSRAAHGVANPVSALLLSLGGLYALYFTPLYAATTASEPLHHLVHLHFLLAGYLFAWVIAGPDPAPRRLSVPARLVVLGVAIAVHAGLSQLMYAGLYVRVPVPTDQLQAGAQLMYYGGDIAELLLALAMVSTWRPRRRPTSPVRPRPQLIRVRRNPWFREEQALQQPLE